jgi:archaeosine synthase
MGRPRLGGEPGLPEGVEWVVLASAASLVSKPNRFVDAIMATRARAGPGRLLYVPGMATPRSLALLAYMGTDVVDDVMCHLEAARNRRSRPELGHVHGPGGAGPAELAMENLVAMRRELALVREAIGHDALRELVEVRVRSEPWQVAALRRLDTHHHKRLLPFCPVHRDRPLMALSREALGRVEVLAWTGRLRERYAPPPSAKVLVLLPCSARKPYSSSRTHRRIAKALESVTNRASLHEVVLTSPLGVVPRELERTYPAAQYDIPVSGDWFGDELERMAELVAHTRTQGAYGTVVSHMGDDVTFLADDGSVVRSRHRGEGPLDRGALERLAELVNEATSQAPKVSWKDRMLEDVTSLARFQFGPDLARDLAEGCHVRGRTPGLRLMGPDGGQRATVVPSRGLLSLTLDGAAVVAAGGSQRVWMDDFELKGDLFAVGVTDVDPTLRPAEEAVVIRDDQVVGVGVARMAAPEMMAMSRGVAVSMRHRRSGGGGQ